jgi:hypothetical protein
VIPRTPRVWWLAAALAGTAAGALSYPEWVRGFTQQLDELEITAASRGGKSVSVSWRGDSGGKEYPAAELSLQHPSATQPWHIRITYLAQRNAAAKDTEVRLLKVSSPEPIVWKDFASGPVWKQGPNNLGSLRQSLAARGNTPGAVDIERTGGTLTLQFERHKLGGLAQVTVNGESRTVDLYSPETGVETLTWQPDLAAETAPAVEVLRTRIGNPPGRLRNLRLSATPEGRAEIRSVKLDGVPLREVSAGVFAAPGSYWTAPARALIASLGTWLAAAALLFLLALLWSQGAEASRALGRATAVLSAIAIGAFWTAVYYPALMSDDSFDCWNQAVEGALNKWHPNDGGHAGHLRNFLRPFDGVPGRFGRLDSRNAALVRHLCPGESGRSAGPPKDCRVHVGDAVLSHLAVHHHVVEGRVVRGGADRLALLGQTNLDRGAVHVAASGRSGGVPRHGTALPQVR